VNRLLVALVVITAALRVGWFLVFVVASMTQPRTDAAVSRFKQLRRDARLPRSLADEQALKSRGELFKSQTTAAYTLGGLSLASFAGVRASQSTAPRLSLVMLAVAATAAIAAPLLFRLDGGELTRMGFDSALSIAGLAFAVGSLTLIRSVLAMHNVTRHIFWLLPTALAARDVLDTIHHTHLTVYEVFPESWLARSKAQRSR
jgi:hypothetical protein